jgi:2-polyprenyl-3-methyl-5-hydroxy-6-metoxy-1,4-benzoquinol methylase
MGKSQFCYLCKGEDLKKRPGRVRDNPELEIYECISCGLVFLSSFKHIDENYYESACMHCGESDMDLENWVRETAWDDERRFNFLLSSIKGKKILDFGCGNGGFLKQAGSVASHAVGIEIETRLKTYFEENRLTVYNDISSIEDHFDFITLFHVLEHVPDPVGLLEQLSKKLRKDGCIIIEVPNANDILLTLYENTPFSYFTYWSPHLFLFSNATLKMVTNRAGLETNYIKQIQRYPLSNHLYWLAKGKPGGHKEWGFLDSPELSLAYENQLSSIGGCDTIFASFFNPRPS